MVKCKYSIKGEKTNYGCNHQGRSYVAEKEIQERVHRETRQNTLTETSLSCRGNAKRFTNYCRGQTVRRVRSHQELLNILR